MVAVLRKRWGAGEARGVRDAFLRLCVRWLLPEALPESTPIDVYASRSGRQVPLEAIAGNLFEGLLARHAKEALSLVESLLKNSAGCHEGNGGRGLAWRPSLGIHDAA